MARKRIIAGNWKMNMTPSEAVKLVEEFTVYQLLTSFLLLRLLRAQTYRLVLRTSTSRTRVLTQVRSVHQCL